MQPDGHTRIYTTLTDATNSIYTTRLTGKASRVRAEKSGLVFSGRTGTDPNNAFREDDPSPRRLCVS